MHDDQTATAAAAYNTARRALARLRAEYGAHDCPAGSSYGPRFDRAIARLETARAAYSAALAAADVRPEPETAPEPPSCTVVVSADGARCGAPTVATFTARSGAVYSECSEHYRPSTADATATAPELPSAPRNRSSRAYLILTHPHGPIVGYSDSYALAAARAARIGAVVVRNDNGAGR